MKGEGTNCAAAWHVDEPERGAAVEGVIAEGREARWERDGGERRAVAEGVLADAAEAGRKRDGG